MHTIASFHGRGWCPAFRHAASRFISHFGSTAMAHLRIVHVWPECPAADLLLAFLRRASTSSSLKGGSIHVGFRGGSSSKFTSTLNGVWEKKHCERTLVISLCMCTNPSGPCNDGTFDTLRPCLQAATSQSCAFSMYSLAHLLFAIRTVPLSLACVEACISFVWAFRRFCIAIEQ